MVGKKQCFNFILHNMYSRKIFYVQDEHDNCHPLRTSENTHERKLGEWMSEQRHLKKSGKLKLEREAKLNAINFVWNGNASNAISAWNDKFLQLKTWLVSGYYLNFLTI